MEDDLWYLSRCAQLATLADGRTGNSPRVGAVLVYRNRIIGEGFHARAGSYHAEVRCLKSVRSADRPFIAQATLYVSLEPCCIVGRSGACTNVILENNIPTLVFAQRDPTPGVAGRSVALLRTAGVTVREYPDFEPTKLVNSSRRTMVVHRRPYVILKYARSADGFLRPADRSERYWITGPLSRRLVHRWRADATAILVGGRTIVEDDPSLTTRLFPGPNPQPVVWDPRNRVTGGERVFRASRPPLLFTGSERGILNARQFVTGPQLDEGGAAQVLAEVLKQGYGSLLVEGGAAVLSTFLRAGLWDEARVFTGSVRFGDGLPAPLPDGATLADERSVGTDRLRTYRNPAPRSLPAI